MRAFSIETESYLRLASRQRPPAMSHPYRSWTRRDFLKLAGRAGLLGAFPTLASAAAAFEPDTACISILLTTELLIAVVWRAASHKSADGGGKIRTRSWSMSAMSTKAQR